MPSVREKRRTMLQNVIAYTGAVVRSKKCVSALEYGILAAVIVGAVATAVVVLSTDLNDAFKSVGALIKSEAANAK